MFAPITITDTTSLDSGDTHKHPSAVDYLTKYQDLVPGKDDSYIHFGAELEEKESNDRHLGEAEEEPVFQELDERYS